jgi:hypothetical protein
MNGCRIGSRKTGLGEMTGHLASPRRFHVSTRAAANILFQDRRIEMVVKTAKELLETFRRFQSLSNPGKRRMRAIKRMSSSSEQFSQL